MMLWRALFFIGLLAWTGRAGAVSLPEAVVAKSALLVDAQTGQVLFQRAPDTPYLPASTTKLMTALLVWEQTGLRGTLQVAPEDTLVEPSHIPLRPGEVVSVRDLTSALLIGSDNDSAMALGRSCSGDLDKFIARMNARARELGCTHTLFCNPNGLPGGRQYTSANDLLKIFRAVLAVPELRRICSTRMFLLKTEVGTQRLKNHNRLLGVYPGMGPAKTGWTMASRHTYAASATRSGRELYLIILNSANKWNDARILFDYGFANLPAKTKLHQPEVVLASAPAAAPDLHK